MPVVESTVPTPCMHRVTTPESPAQAGGYHPTNHLLSPIRPLIHECDYSDPQLLLNSESNTMVTTKPPSS